MDTKRLTGTFFTISLFLAVVCFFAAGAAPVAAQTANPQDPCGGLPECGYILMHMKQVPAALPDCSDLPECGYIQMHIQGSAFHTAVTVIPFTKPGIPPTGCNESLYIGQGYYLVCSGYHPFGQ